MNINELKKKFPNENASRRFFESVIWADGRKCPHCNYQKSYLLKSESVKPGTYECSRCKKEDRGQVSTFDILKFI